MDANTLADGGTGNEPVAKVLFDQGEGVPEPTPGPGGSPRLRYANRHQVEMRICAFDSLIPEDHPVRVEQDVVGMERVAQDGMKVRASAGAASFRRRSRLEQFRDEAQTQVEALKKELENDPTAGTRRQQAARQRAAADRAERLRQAL